jgi:hypothetical protein
MISGFLTVPVELNEQSEGGAMQGSSSLPKLLAAPWIGSCAVLQLVGSLTAFGCGDDSHSTLMKGAVPDH